MTVSYSGSNIAFDDGSTVSSGWTHFKNRIINGAMVIAQRGTTPTSTNLWYPADRFRLAVNNSSKVNLSQSTIAPPGFVNSILATSLAATTVGAAEGYELSHQIEGYNTADLMWGTAAAKAVTLSFWVRSSLTGTFGGAFENSGNTRAYPFSYTISAANTWEQKTITVAGDTSGTWLTDNSRGIIIRWSLGMGSNLLTTANAWVAGDYQSVTGETKLVATNGANWYITGVQLEIGSTASSFEYRPYGQELLLCQRYYQRITPNTNGNAGDGAFVVMTNWNTTSSYAAYVFPVPMRTGPSGSYSALSDLAYLSNSAGRTPTSFDLSNNSNTRVELLIQYSTVTIAGYSGWLRIGAGGFVAFSAEL
jgi:hypothetical protein